MSKFLTWLCEQDRITICNYAAPMQFKMVVKDFSIEEVNENSIRIIADNFSCTIRLEDFTFYDSNEDEWKYRDELFIGAV